MFNRMMPLYPQDISGYPDQASMKINQMQECIREMWAAIYPVGCYFETSNSNFDPNRIWGGEWEEVSTGRWHRTA